LARKLCEVLAQNILAENVIPASVLFVIGNVLLGSDDQTAVMVEAGIVPILNEVLKVCSVKQTRREVVWMLSNIATCGILQIKSLIDQNSHFMLVDIMANEEEHLSVKKECIWALTNCLCCGFSLQVANVVAETNVVQCLAVFATLDPSMRNICFRGLKCAVSNDFVRVKASCELWSIPGALQWLKEIGQNDNIACEIVEGVERTWRRFSFYSKLFFISGLRSKPEIINHKLWDHNVLSGVFKFLGYKTDNLDPKTVPFFVHSEFADY